ncbi:hypothetical protein V493_08560 [Pseudogymnoascus sp. VKM F-4281 (FW-2241)]|nr:hypothetical protein V493_08560 [Pseudogymnoascus sp. VKM F-4281 (FW-2241)]
MSRTNERLQMRDGWLIRVEAAWTSKAACTPILSRKWPGGGHRALETGNGPLIRKCASPKDPFTDTNPKARVVWQGPECDFLLWPLSGDGKYFGWIVWNVSTIGPGNRDLAHVVFLAAAVPEFTAFI